MSSGEDDFFADLAPVRKALPKEASPPPPPPREPTPPPPEEPKEKEPSPPPGPPMRKPAPQTAVPPPVALPFGDGGVAAEVAATLRRFEAGLSTVLRGMNR